MLAASCFQRLDLYICQCVYDGLPYHLIIRRKYHRTRASTYRLISPISGNLFYIYLLPSGQGIAPGELCFSLLKVYVCVVASYLFMASSFYLSVYLVAYSLSGTAFTTYVKYPIVCIAPLMSSICSHCHYTLHRSFKSATCCTFWQSFYSNCGTFSSSPSSRSLGINLECH